MSWRHDIRLRAGSGAQLDGAVNEIEMAVVSFWLLRGGFAPRVSLQVNEMRTSNERVSVSCQEGKFGLRESLRLGFPRSA